jgi:hypothetical protein
VNRSVLLLLVTCLRAGAIAAQEPPQSLADSLRLPRLIATITPVLGSPYSGLPDGAVVVQSDAEWKEAWANAWHSQEQPDWPVVDFSHSTVIRAIRGFEYGDSVVVDSLTSQTGRAVVWVRTIRACSIAPTITEAVVFIEVPRLPPAVRFMEHSEPAPECREGS